MTDYMRKKYLQPEWKAWFGAIVCYFFGHKMVYARWGKRRHYYCVCIRCNKSEMEINDGFKPNNQNRYL